MKTVHIFLLFAVFFSCFHVNLLCAQLQAQTTPQSPKQSTPQPKSSPSTNKNETGNLIDDEAIETQRRTFAVSLIMTLADEARSYKDLSLRSRVLARSADALWNVDSDSARTLFRRAWEAAEKADVEANTGPPAKNAPPVMVIALRKISGGDLRSEVLNLAARRDRALGEEFLAKLNEAAASAERNGEAAEPTNDSWTTSDETSKRLRLAHQLLDENEIERAVEFAKPVLYEVNEKTISFLSKLRTKKPELADKQFLLMLTRAEVDPRADANTVSGLSSYAFTPGFYVTFAADGGIRWAPAIDPISAPNLPLEVRNRFFHVGGNILLRPSPPPDQDSTSAGRTGRYAVIRRLLPLFEQYAPDTAIALRSQLTLLTEQGFKSLVSDENSLVTQGIKQEPTPGSVLDKLEERIGRARTEFERSQIYADTAVVLAKAGDLRSQDLTDKIENTQHRKIIRQYVDLCLMRAAIAKKDVTTATRLAKSESLTNSQRAWAYTQAARLVMNSDRTRAAEMLEEALAEARRVDADDDTRPGVMIAIGNEFLRADKERPWEIAAETIKAANAVENYSGEERGINAAVMIRSGLQLLELDASGSNLAAFVRQLAKVDFTRASDLAKSFKYDAPRAVATLAVASAALEKQPRSN